MPARTAAYTQHQEDHPINGSAHTPPPKSAHITRPNYCGLYGCQRSRNSQDVKEAEEGLDEVEQSRDGIEQRFRRQEHIYPDFSEPAMPSVWVGAGGRVCVGGWVGDIKPVSGNLCP